MKIKFYKENPNYLIYDDGRVYSLYKNKFLKSFKVSGYLLVGLSINKKVYYKSISRLIGETFISNPEGKQTINHKNGIKTDNRVENLEWCTCSENQLHSYQKLGRINSMKGKHHSEQTKRKMSLFSSGENNSMYGKHHSEKTKQKMSRVKVGKHHSKESKQKMSESHEGKKYEHSEEYKRKINKLIMKKNNKIYVYV